MKHTLTATLSAAAALTTMLAAAPLAAELPPGARAPLFATQGALKGKPFAFNLATALHKGPVVLYFYPKSFTSGCTLEAHAFAEASKDFAAAGATLIGLSADDLATQQKFSRSECRDKFAVAVATPEIVAAYQVALNSPDGKPTGLTTRTSYVIARDGTIKLTYSNMDYKDHVAKSLAAVRSLKGAKTKG